MDNQIKYTVSLQDQISGKLGGMDAQAKKLESSISGLNKIAGVLGISFAAFKGIGLMKEGIEAVEKLHQAQAQIRAGLESTANAAGVTSKSLDDMAKKFASSSKYSRTDITELQSLMLTFPAITKETFPQATQAIMDMSTRLGQDTKSSAIQLGKALQDPVKGISALHRVGVNFSESQKEMIKNFVKTGQVAKAQQLIISELNTEFGGSAKAAFDADPLAKFNKMMGSMKMAMGEAGLYLIEKLLPTLMRLGDVVKNVAEKIKEIVHWFEQHKTITGILTTFISTLSSVLFILYLRQKLVAMWTGIVSASMVIQTFQMGVMSGALGGLSTAASIYAGILAVIDAINPFAWIVASIVAVSTAVIYCYNHFEKFRATVEGLWEVIKRWGKNVAETILGLAELTSGNLISGFKRLKDVFSNGGESTAQAFARGFNKSMQDFNKETFQEHLKNSIADFNKKVDSGLFKNLDEYNKKVSYFKTQLDKKVKSGLLTKDEEKEALGSLKGYRKITQNGPGTATKEPSKVKGTSITTINIHIDSLVKSFNVNTTNIQEAADKIKDKVALALTGAVNDSQNIK